jgi:hypothetical protein
MAFQFELGHSCRWGMVYIVIMTLSPNNATGLNANHTSVCTLAAIVEVPFP